MLHLLDIVGLLYALSILAWACVGDELGLHWVELEAFRVFLEVGNKSQLKVVLEARLGWIWEI